MPGDILKYLKRRYNVGNYASVFAGCLALLFFSGCELLGDDPTPGVRDVEVISYETHIQSIFDARCTSCHGPDRSRAGLRLDDWSQLIQGSEFGEAIIPFSGTDSRLVKLVNPASNYAHPDNVGKEKLSSDEFELLKRWIDEGAVGPLGSSPFSSSLNLIYIAHDSEPTVTVVDSDAWLVVRRIHLEDYGFSNRARVHHVAVEPDGSFWYASIGSPRQEDVQTIAKFNRFNELIGKYDTLQPGLIALHPTQDVLYVSRLATSTSERSLLEIRRSDLAAVKVPISFASDHALAVGPSGDYLFSASIDVDQMSIVNLANLEVSYFDIKGVKHGFGQFAISPDGTRMWGAGIESKTVTLFDISNPLAVVQRQSLNVPGRPLALTFLPDASRVYITVPDGNRVSIVNTWLDLIESEIKHAAIQEPTGIATSVDGSYIFVTNRNSQGNFAPRHLFEGDTLPGTMVVIDTATETVVKAIELASQPGLIGSRVVVPTFR